MKIKIEVDCTPEEARNFFGLPNVKPMQEAVMARIENKCWMPRRACLLKPFSSCGPRSFREIRSNSGRHSRAFSHPPSVLRPAARVSRQSSRWRSPRRARVAPSARIVPPGSENRPVRDESSCSLLGTVILLPRPGTSEQPVGKLWQQKRRPPAQARALGPQQPSRRQKGRPPRRERPPRPRSRCGISRPRSLKTTKCRSGRRMRS